MTEGTCLCGCGEVTTLASRNDRHAKTQRGKPLRYIAGHQRRKSPVAWIEEDRGYETPCHIWKRCVNNKGYGVLTRNGKHVYAHIDAYVSTYGPIPQGKELDHKCRVHECRNPEHLEAVTHAENMRRSAVVRYSKELIQSIREADSRMLHTEVAAMFQVEKSYVCRIRNGYRRAVDRG